MSKDLKAKNHAYHLAALITDAESESISLKIQIDRLYSFDRASIVEAENSIISVTYEGHTSSIAIPLFINGSCIGSNIKITAYPNGTVYVRGAD